MKNGTQNKPILNVRGEVKTVEGEKRLSITSQAYYRQQLAKLKDGPVSITVSMKVPTRSQSQLAYHWVLMGYIGDHTGYTKDEIHDVLMRLQFGTKTIQLMGKEYEARRSVADAAHIAKTDMVELITRDLEVCADLGINVPTAMELGYITN